MDFPTATAMAICTSQKQSGILRHIKKSVYQRFVLGNLERRTLQTSQKNRVTIDATGMYIPIRAHFKRKLEMGLGYLHM